MCAYISEPLFIFEMANNHMGDLAHGVRIIREIGLIARKFPSFKFAFKMQYRDLDTFIHPSKIGRDDVKYVKRFSETRLNADQFMQLVGEMRNYGFLAVSTPFDEPSVDMIDKQQLDMVKIASCSFTDWPLLERIAQSDLPIIASTAGASQSDIDRVVFFFSNRKKTLSILHCVGEYPTPPEHMNLSQIDFLKKRYPAIKIGFSTHEDPENTDFIKIAIAKGASVFEKHVGIACDSYSLNAYSASPIQVEKWLSAAQSAFEACGTENRNAISNVAEQASLRSLQRGIFAKRPIQEGSLIQRDDIYFAFPPEEGQFTANDWSKYVQCTAKQSINPDEAVSSSNAILIDQRDQILKIAQDATKLLQDGGIIFPVNANLEISHHYGIERFPEYGLTMLTIVNRAYCKKILILFPGQRHPEQYHKNKEETFHVLYGEINLELDGKPQICKPGDVVTINPGVKHAFSSDNGAVIEEISNTHFTNDSFYTDPTIDVNKNRKTFLNYWFE